MGKSYDNRVDKELRDKARSDNSFQCVPALVVDNQDPEHQHRIKVIIPIWDETNAHDEWVKQMGGFAGSRGYGNWDIPAIGSEVVLFSERGEGVHLYYQPVYNENNLTPGDFNDETSRGMRSDGDLKFICNGDFIIEGGRVLIKSRYGTIQISGAAGIIFNPEDEDEE